MADTTGDGLALAVVFLAFPARDCVDMDRVKRELNADRTIDVGNDGQRTKLFGPIRTNFSPSGSECSSRSAISNARTELDT